MEKFKAQAKDKGGDWKVMLVGSPQEARSKVVLEAGAMVQGGWVVAGMNRQQITVAHPDDPERRTEFRVSKVVER